MTEDGNTYHQSGTAENVAAYPHGGEAKDDAVYQWRHGGEQHHVMPWQRNR